MGIFGGGLLKSNSEHEKAAEQCKPEVSHSIMWRSSDSEYAKTTAVAKEKPTFPLPRANNFDIIQYQQYGPYLFLVLKYPDCTNFEGTKVLIYRVKSLRKLLSNNKGQLDPHFLRGSKFIHPIARFEPTKSGISLAKAFCRAACRKWDQKRQGAGRKEFHL